MYDQDGDDLRSSFTTYLAEGDKVNSLLRVEHSTQHLLRTIKINEILVVSEWRFSKGARILHKGLDAKTRR